MKLSYIEFTIYHTQQNYLTKFGYLTQSSNEIANVQSKDHLQEAIRNLQKFANIPITGILDSKTRK